jgi:hypothetical protein
MHGAYVSRRWITRTGQILARHRGVAGESTRSGPANSSLTRPDYCLAMKRVLALVVVALVVVATSSAQTRRKDPLRLTYVIEGRGICLAGPTHPRTSV